MSNETSNAHRQESRLAIAGEGRDEIGRRYFQFEIEGAHLDIPPVSCDTILKDPNVLYSALVHAGWNGFTTKTKSRLLQRLEKRGVTKPKFKVATRLGWHSGAFALGRRVIGSAKLPLRLSLGDLDREMVAKYRCKGTLKKWQKWIAKPCKGNSRLMFVVALAFTGPLLRLTAGPRGGGFQICGEAGAGKTTAGMISGSVWGCHRAEGRREKGFMETWNSTAAKVEVTALAHSDTLLILDETKRAGAKERERAQMVAAASFGLAEGCEKERLTNPGSARSWRCYFLSTSNLSFEQLAKAGAVDIDDAHRGRFVDIPLPTIGHGIFENLHGFHDGEQMSDTLQRRSCRVFGTPGAKFMALLAEEWRQNRRELKKSLAEDRKFYRRELAKRAQAEGLVPLARSSSRFATAFAAGCKAIRYRILTWSREQTLEAILSCELDQIRLSDSTRTTASARAGGLREKLIRYLSEAAPAFVDLKVKRPERAAGLNKHKGYVERKNGVTWYYMTSEQLQAIIGRGPDAGALKRALVEAGYLAQDTPGKFVVQRSIFADGKGRQKYAWVYALKAAILKTEPS